MIKVSCTLPPKTSVYGQVQVRKETANNIKKVNLATQSSNISFGQSISKVLPKFRNLFLGIGLPVMAISFANRRIQNSVSDKQILDASDPIAICQVSNVESCQKEINDYKNSIHKGVLDKLFFSSEQLKNIKGNSDAIAACRDRMSEYRLFDPEYDANFINKDACKSLIESVPGSNAIDKALNADKESTENLYLDKLEQRKWEHHMKQLGNYDGVLPAPID